MVTKNNTQLKTLKISPELHGMLTDMGGKGDTFEFIIRRLIVRNVALEDALNRMDEKDRKRLEKKMEEEYEKKL